MPLQGCTFALSINPNDEEMKESDRGALFEAFWSGDAARVEEQLSDLLFDTISYHDYKESFYHAFLAGIFTGSGYAVASNDEAGLGRQDLTVKDRAHRRALVIEVKHAQTEEELPKKCEEACLQIQEKQYLSGIDKGFRQRTGYGIAFYGKECRVRLYKPNL